MSDVTHLLLRLEQGDPLAADQLLPLVYDELKRLAASRLAKERPGQTLQTTALVHEAYLRLLGDGEPHQYGGRAHFLAAAAEAMRRILVDVARQRHSQRRGGGRRRFDLLDGDLVSLPISDELLDLNEALDNLQPVDAQAAEVVKLRVFAGMTIDEMAAHLGISPRTVKRSWAYGRAWLSRALQE